MPLLGVEAPSAAWRNLGFDVAQAFPGWNVLPFFGCSPLSCNELAQHVPVNAHCLLDSLDSAQDLARAWSIEQPEPGTYFVIQVLEAHPGP